ncbi:unnamed protein product [Rotaria sordida]|uniref:Beta-lactamase-related domain-containing protein n=1 Tax=Rotaria sordida TaxID=392033 RepID=A0A815AML4_9BILA|nr:unnamed protein product [Rotaria sordida]CAF1541749.1 unnamed protein product [Rotaria sordida]
MLLFSIIQRCFIRTILRKLSYDNPDLYHNAEIFKVITSLALKYDIPGIEALIIQTIGQEQLSDVIAHKNPNPYHLMGYATYGTRRADINSSLLRNISIYDAFHIGSCAKSMAAILIANAIESNLFHIQYNTTLRQIFSYLTWSKDNTSTNGLGLKLDYLSSSEYLLKESFTVDSSWNNVTLAHLLTHTSGIQDESTKETLWSEIVNIEAKNEVDNNNYLFPSRRYTFGELLKTPLAKPPSSVNSPSGYMYSNFGYMIIGLVLEELYSAPYETIIKRLLFDKLHMNSNSTGFGAPQSDENKLNPPKQPYGHYRVDNQWVSTGEDNPSAITAAGRIHFSGLDWTKYIANHLYRARDNNANNDPIISSSSIYETLQSPYKFANASLASTYTIGGWQSEIHSAYPGGLLLWHSGSNGYFMSYAFLYPKADVPFAILVNYNAGSMGDDADREILYGLNLVYNNRNKSNDGKWTNNDNINYVGTEALTSTGVVRE